MVPLRTGRRTGEEEHTMFSNLIAGDRARWQLGALAGIGLLGAASLSPLSLAGFGTEGGAQGGAALARDLQRPGVYCLVANWQTAPANPSCFSTSIQTRNAWFGLTSPN